MTSTTNPSSHINDRTIVGSRSLSKTCPIEDFHYKVGPLVTVARTNFVNASRKMSIQFQFLLKGVSIPSVSWCVCVCTVQRCVVCTGSCTA